jgi:hypothetical protein
MAKKKLPPWLEKEPEKQVPKTVKRAPPKKKSGKC